MISLALPARLAEESFNCAAKTYNSRSGRTISTLSLGLILIATSQSLLNPLTDFMNIIVFSVYQSLSSHLKTLFKDLFKDLNKLIHYSNVCQWINLQLF